MKENEKLSPFTTLHTCSFPMLEKGGRREGDQESSQLSVVAFLSSIYCL